MSLLLDDSESERDFVLCSRKGREEEGASPNRCFVSAVLSVTQYNSKSRIRARSNIQIFTELMTASIVYRSKSIMYSIHSTLMLYITGVASSHITLMHAMAFVVLGLSGPVVAKITIALECEKTLGI